MVLADRRIGAEFGVHFHGIRTEQLAVNAETVAVHTLESEGDTVYRKAVAGLFTNGVPPEDLVRQKDMLFALEGGMDVCEDAMDVIRSVVVKNG